MADISREVGNLDTNVSFFKSELVRNGVLDPENVHHEFKSGLHGQKIDFDRIETGSRLYNLWAGVTAHYIEKNFNPVPVVLVGVANGTNRLVRSAAPLLDDQVEAITTEKVGASRIALSQLGRTALKKIDPDLALVLEDVGTTGQSARSVVEALKLHGVSNVAVLCTWQRQNKLTALDEAKIPYSSVIFSPLPTLEPEVCAGDPGGLCYRGVELISYGKD